MVELEQIISFYVKASKSGPHYLFTIPKHLVDLGIIEIGEQYRVIIEKVGEQKEEEG